MPTPLDQNKIVNRLPIPQKQVVNREAVRILALEHGLKRASELSGVNYQTVRQWSVRGKWKLTPSHSQASITSQNIGDTVQAELQEHEKQTRLSLARATSRLSHDAEGVSLRDSKHVLNVAKTAAITHRWEGKDQAQANVMVNVALLGISPQQMARTVNSTSTDDTSR